MWVRYARVHLSDTYTVVFTHVVGMAIMAPAFALVTVRDPMSTNKFPALMLAFETDSVTGAILPLELGRSKPKGLSTAVCDPRSLSRTHATISHVTATNSFIVASHSSAGVVVETHTRKDFLACGKTAEIFIGDRLRLGGLVVRLVRLLLDDAPLAAGSTITPRAKPDLCDKTTNTVPVYVADASTVPSGTPEQPNKPNSSHDVRLSVSSSRTPLSPTRSLRPPGQAPRARAPNRMTETIEEEEADLLPAMLAPSLPSGRQHHDTTSHRNIKKRGRSDGTPPVSTLVPIGSLGQALDDFLGGIDAEEQNGPAPRRQPSADQQRSPLEQPDSNPSFRREFTKADVAGTERQSRPLWMLGLEDSPALRLPPTSHGGPMPESQAVYFNHDAELLPPTRNL
jgi:hypothetical protein